jgi:hypothetical protein
MHRFLSLLCLQRLGCDVFAFVSVLGFVSVLAFVSVLGWSACCCKVASAMTSKRELKNDFPSKL